MKVYEIIEATKGKLLSGDLNVDIHGFNQDSRMIKPNDMYIPIIGERLDGHKFIQSAFDNGACAILTSQMCEYKDKIVIYVEDTVVALQQMARYLRQHRNIKVVGITGSVGKTSTKDMVYSVVSKKYKTLKTLGNYNNEIGLPLTILRHYDEEVLILEMGMNHMREMALLSSIALPDIGAITNVGTAHIGELGSRDNILKAKMEIIEGMQDNSVLVINQDNDMLKTVQVERLQVERIGLHDKNCHYLGANVILHENNSEFDIVHDGIKKHVLVPVQGEHFVYNALIAIAIGVHLDIDLDLCIEGVQEFELTKNRMDSIVLKDHITLIDGTYNASEDSMKSSIDVLANYARRKIAILADMLEMGKFSKELHASVGNYVAKKNIDILIVVGNDAKYILEAARNQGMKEVYYCKDNQEVLQYVKRLLQKEDVVLLKGSNGMNLKEVVENIKEKFS